MIIFSTERIYPFPVGNCIELEITEGEGYIYTSLHTYTSAIRMNDLVGGDYNRAYALTNGASSKREDWIEDIYEILPTPINILSPFLLKVSNVIGDSAELSVIVGALHTITKSIDIVRYISLPENTRANITYTKNIVMEYQSDWNDILIPQTMQIEYANRLIQAVQELTDRIQNLEFPTISYYDDDEDDRPRKKRRKRIRDDDDEDDEEETTLDDTIADLLETDPFAAFAAAMEAAEAEANEEENKGMPKNEKPEPIAYTSNPAPDPAPTEVSSTSSVSSFDPVEFAEQIRKAYPDLKKDEAEIIAESWDAMPTESLTTLKDFVVMYRMRKAT